MKHQERLPIFRFTLAMTLVAAAMLWAGGVWGLKRRRPTLALA